MSIISTHLRPDLDAIASVWLLKRFVPAFHNATVEFANTATADANTLARAAAVVDTGGIYDAARWRFDHHQLPGAQSTMTCAARLVWDELRRHGADVADLAPLIALVHDGDSHHPHAATSDTVGLHALLRAYEQRDPSDHGVLAFGKVLLDLLAEQLKRTATAVRTLGRAIRYTAADKAFLAVEGGRELTEAALANGAGVVLFFEQMPQQHSIAVGLLRRAGSAVDVGALVGAALQRAETSATVAEELRRWYRHPAGFFSGRGTAKAPDGRALAAPLGEIAAALDAAWHR